MKKWQECRFSCLCGKHGKKHLAEICFEDQMFVKDDKKSVTAKMAEIGKEAGANLEFVTTKLFVLGK